MITTASEIRAMSTKLTLPIKAGSPNNSVTLPKRQRKSAHPPGSAVVFGPFQEVLLEFGIFQRILA